MSCTFPLPGKVPRVKGGRFRQRTPNARKVPLMRKVLKFLLWTFLGASVLLDLVAATLGVLYWLYPTEFLEKARYYWDPWEQGEVAVQTDEPKTSAPLP